MATAMETQGPHISDLPVDALLEVFSRLPAADLTQGVTGVCRAWRDFAMEPAAWRSRRVQVAPRKHRPLTAAERRVLRRAPALRALAVSLRRAQDLPDKLSTMLPICEQLRELQLSLPCLSADMAEDAVRHWPRLQQLRVEALILQENSLERLGELGQLRGLQLATLQPAGTFWGPLRRAIQQGFPSLRSLHLDARCDTDSTANMDETVGVILGAADRLAHLRLGVLVPADKRLLAAAGQCDRLQSLHVEDCTAMTDAGLLCLAGLRLQSLTLLHARDVSTAALQHFLRVADLSLLRHLDLSGCPALTDRVVHLIAARCSHPPTLVAADCPNISRQALPPVVGNSPAPCTVAAAARVMLATPARPLGVV